MRILRLFLGMVAGNAAGGLVCLLVVLVAKATNSPVILPSLLFVPILIGYVAMLIWRPLNLSGWKASGQSFLCMIVGLGGAWFFLKEGIICLIMASPLVFICIVLGTEMARKPFGGDPTKLSISVIPLAILLMVAETRLRVDVTSVVTDEILIHAPPHKVFPHVTAFPEITAPPHYWLFKLGLPMPMATTTTGNFVGADRNCIFTGGAVFKEKVSEIIPDQKLTFDIVEAPRDPELLGHLDLQRGQFELRDNHDGTTTLIGRSWYALHVRPRFYFDWWTQDVFRAVHLRVMENIRDLSEHGP